MKKITIMALLACTMMLFVAQQAMAADSGATAYVNITNQATATYYDAAATPGEFTADSNIVTVVMHRIYGVTVSIGTADQCEPVGNTVNYTATVTNAGNMTDTFTITGALPASVGPLAPGGTADVTMSVTIIVGGSTDSVTATSTGGTLGTPASFIAHPSASDSANSTVCEGDLGESTKTAGADNYKAGDVASFTITVHNSGTYDATNVHVHDEMPTAALESPFTAKVGGVDVGAWVANVFDYDIGTMAQGGADVVIVVTGKVKSGLTDNVSTIDNTATITSDGPGGPWTPTDPTPPVVYAPVLTVDKFQSLDGATWVTTNLDRNPGETIYYKVVVNNTGHAVAKTVTIADSVSTYLGTLNVTTAGIGNAHVSGSSIVTDAVDLPALTNDAMNFVYTAVVVNQ